MVCYVRSAGASRRREMCIRDSVWSLADILVDGDGYSAELEGAMHRTIKKVTEDIEALKMNTAIAAMMSLLNEIYDKKSLSLIHI